MAYHRQAMTVPAKSALNMEATLVGPPGHNVLDCASQDVAIVRQACGKRWTVIKCVSANNICKEIFPVPLCHKFIKPVAVSGDQILPTQKFLCASI